MKMFNSPTKLGERIATLSAASPAQARDLAATFARPGYVLIADGNQIIVYKEEE